MRTLDEVMALFPADVRARYDFSCAVYTGALARITGVRCASHGEFSQYAAQFRKGRGCPSCGGQQRIISLRTPAQAYFTKVAELYGGKYDYSNSVFVQMNAPLTVRCPVHGDFTLSANHHFYRKQGCGACELEAKRTRILRYRHLSAQSKIDNTAKTFFERCIEAHEGKYTYPEQEYRGAKEKIRVVCPVHGEFEQAAWAHLSGKGCMQCSASDPKWERELATYIESLGFSTQRSVRLLDKQHIDIYVASANVGIELHGLYWHTEQFRDKRYHRAKWEMATERGIRLVQVFEDEWRDKAGVVRARIAAILGKADKCDARKMRVAVIDTMQSKSFLDAHHIQGAVVAQRHYGLYDGNDTLMAVATFGAARSGAMAGVLDTDAWEVLRYASIGRVRGGFTRLFKRFLTDINPSKVVSYCDLRYGDGRLYAASGFTLAGLTDLDYWWVPLGRVVRIPRYATQKHKLAAHPVLGEFYAPDKTERQICEAAGWSRIFGVGNQRWVWSSA